MSQLKRFENLKVRPIISKERIGELESGVEEFIQNVAYKDKVIKNIQKLIIAGKKLSKSNVHLIGILWGGWE